MKGEPMPLQLEDPREQRTQLRKHLYQSGFTPVPTKNKVALYPNWSKMDVTPDEIDVWATRACSSGLAKHRVSCGSTELWTKSAR